MNCRSRYNDDGCSIIFVPFSVSSTYDHKTLKIRLPVRSAIYKQCTGGLVVRWVTTSESPLLYVFVFAPHSGGGAGQHVLVAEYWPSDSFDDRPRITYSIHPVFLESEHHSCRPTPFSLQRSNVVVDSALETSVRHIMNCTWPSDHNHSRTTVSALPPW